MSKYHALFVFNPFSKIDAMPMAPALLKGICDSHGLKTTTLDLNIEIQIDYNKTHFATEIEKYLQFFAEMTDEAREWYKKYIKKVAQKLLDYDADWIGFSLLSYQSLCFTHDICYQIKSMNPKQKILLGGPGISQDDNIKKTYKNNKMMSDIMLETGLADTVFINESENTLVDMLVNGTKGKVQTHKQLTHEELNQVPTPSYIDYKTHLYEKHSKIFHLTDQAAAATITGSKGCVRKCTFCDVFTFEPKFVFKDGNKIADEMIEIYEKQGIKHFMMSDSLINGSMKAFRQMNEALSKRLPNTISYYGEYIARPKGQTTPEDYDLMKQAGCKHVIVGVESGSENVRNHMGKKFNNEDLHLMIQSLNKVGITQEWNLMVGYPTETRKDFEDTMTLVETYKDIKFPDMIINPVGILHLLPGSPLADTHARRLEIEWEDVKENLTGNQYDYWKSKQNPENNFENRVKWWIELLEKAYQYGYMTDYRFSSKMSIAKRLIWHWKQNKK